MQNEYYSTWMDRNDDWTMLMNELSDEVVTQSVLHGSEARIRSDGRDIFVDFMNELHGSPKSLHLQIEPGRSFGDGRHPTTMLCMCLLAEYLYLLDDQKKASINMLDAGTGTGILAILASRMGLRYIDAFDVSVDAVHVASLNMEANGCDSISITRSDLAGFFIPDKKYSIITANLITDVILSNISYLSEMLKEEGRLILSGIGEGRVKDIEDALGGHSLYILEEKNLDGWCGVIAGRK